MKAEECKENDAIAKAPPTTNRGVQNTYGHGLIACVDWLQTTLTFFNDVEVACDLLKVEKCKFILQDRGLYGYKTHWKYGNISILADGGKNMGVHIQMTGQGCREYEEMNLKKWSELFKDISELQGKFTRIDIAIDDIRERGDKPFFTVEKLIRKVKANCAKSYCKKVKVMESIKVEGGKIEGSTLYVGKESSDIQIRFYDKAKERIANGKEIEENVTSWIRSEIQCRRDRAEILADHIASEKDIGSIACGILKNYINFLVPSKDENKARWQVCDWWNDFLGNVNKIKLTQKAPDRTIERTRSWIEKQVAPSLGMLYMAAGDLKEIEKMIAEGVNRMNDTQIAIAIEYQKMKKAEEELWEYRKREKWQEYMFKSVRADINKKIVSALDDEEEFTNVL